MKSSNLSIGARLGATFAALAMLVILVSAFSIRSLGAADTRFESYFEGIGARATTAALMLEAVEGRAIAARNLVLVTDPADVAAEKENVNRAHAEVQERLKRLNELAKAPGVSQKGRELIAEIDRIESLYSPVALHIVQLALAGDKQQAITEMNEKCRPLLAQLARTANEYGDLSLANSKRMVEESHAAYGFDRVMQVLASTAAVLMAVVAGWLVTRSITRPIAQAVKIAETVAAGDLRSRIESGRNDETGKLLAALAAMNGSLKRLVTEVRQSSESIATGSAQIATGNTDLSQRTEQQASSLQETAASMRQLDDTVRSTAADAGQATELAAQASSVAAEGGEAVGQVVRTMGEISESSRKIADIIGVIDGIAFQTNILALNAAVEAARAGEQGRGFAVVAGEVRTLAQRSADAAKEIKSLIGDSVSRVEAGSAQVSRAGRTMGDIVEQVKRVSALIGRMSSTTQEQSTGITHVGQAVSQLDQVTQQNAALVEQSAAAASSLSQQAARLVSAVGVFKLADDAAHAPAAGRA